jgi:UDP-N-acetylmuramyl pentapeptide synthase
MSRFTLDEATLSAIDGDLAAGVPVHQLLGQRTGIAAHRGINGATVVLGGSADDHADVAAALRLLAQLCRDRFRSIVVLERRDDPSAESLEQNDSIGRLIVRLNIAQLVAVGHGARHIQSAAGLEGSWDGESLIVDSVDEAYAFLRDHIRKNDVVLVMGSFGDSATGLIDRQVEASS